MDGVTDRSVTFGRLGKSLGRGATHVPAGCPQRSARCDRPQDEAGRGHSGWVVPGLRCLFPRKNTPSSRRSTLRRGTVPRSVLFGGQFPAFPTLALGLLGILYARKALVERTHIGGP
jgi:hypothetical protein